MQRFGLSIVLGLALLGFGPVQVSAQSLDGAAGLGRGSVLSPILTIDSERLFIQSAFGKRVVAEIEDKSAALAAENRQIEADLESEERELTEMRSTMASEEFRKLADVFDQKVQATRLAQAVKGRSLTDLLDKERAVFEIAAAPVLELLMRESDAAVILDLRFVFASASTIEITDNAIALLDETLGDGIDE